ncbi:uncharacterized protein VTP21DRAFT_2378 [Calcarisporiella thermophila]|uniref:uncharacterized protein n=1 Tax=Calcarisporiella thermophila TaxID=911321 RepID=UPI003743D637
MNLLLRFTGFLAFTFCRSIFPILAAANYTPATNIDLSGFEQLGIAGFYSGISIYKNPRQLINIDPTVASLILQTDDGFESISTSSGPGAINALCSLPRQDGNTDLYIGGNFSTLGNVPVNNIARIDTSNLQVFALSSGLDGPVYALHCDQRTGSVYIGGAFKGPIGAVNGVNSSFGGNVALWQNDIWAPLPFKGFNGPVQYITANPNSNTILFGGLFEGTLNGQFSSSQQSQPVNLQSATITGGNSADLTGFSDPNNVVCSSGDNTNQGSWLLRDGVPGVWRAEFPYKITPSQFRLRNSNVTGKGTKSFRILARPTNTIFNLTYIDPISRQVRHCTDPCELTPDSTIWQEFTVVNPESVQGIELDIESWFGTGGGLSGIEIYQSEIFVHAENSFNSAKCSNSPTASNQLIATGISVGNWHPQFVQGTYRTVLSTDIPADQLSNSNISVTFTPFLPESGTYDLLMNTPGCTGTDTCGRRTQVDVTMLLAPNVTVRATIDQTNKQDREDKLYSGFVVASTNNFQPKIIMTLSANAKPPNSKEINVVADSVQLVKTSPSNILTSVLEYSPINQNPGMNQSSWRALQSQLPPGSIVSSILPTGNGSIFFGGLFTDAISGYSNIVEYVAGQFRPLPGRGLNGKVAAITKIGDDIYVGGSFNSTSDGLLSLNNIARYSLTGRQWTPLGGGTNAPVEKLAVGPLNRLHVAGLFSSLYTDLNKPVSRTQFAPGYAIWDTISNRWSSSPYIAGHIQSLLFSNNSDLRLYIGGVLNGVQSNHATSLASIDAPGNLSSVQLVNESRTPESALSDAQGFPLLSSTQITNKHPIINAGVFYKDTTRGNASITIIGGSFKLGDAKNVAFFENGSWKQLGLNLDGNVNSLFVQNSYLYIAGEFNGSTASGTPLGGIAVWNLSNRTFDTQIPALSSSDGISAKVNVVKGRSTNGMILVGGFFSHAGSLSCNGVCSWDTTTLQWVALSPGLSGEVKDMDLINNNLVVAGNFTVNDRRCYLAKYDFNTPNWTPIGNSGNGDGNLPGPATAVVVNGDINNIFVAGRDKNTGAGYLRKWDGSNYLAIGPELRPSTIINQLMMVPIKGQNPDNNIIEVDRMLMVNGLLDLDPIGNVSSAFFDGRTWHPYLLTSASGGGSGVIKNVFSRSCCPPIFGNNFLPVPIVILISVAIALGLVFMIVLAGLATMYIKRKREAKFDPKPDPYSYYKAPRRPASLLANLALSSMIDPEKKSARQNSETIDHNIARDRSMADEVRAYRAGTSDYLDPSIVGNVPGAAGVVGPIEAAPGRPRPDSETHPNESALHNALQSPSTPRPDSAISANHPTSEYYDPAEAANNDFAFGHVASEAGIQDGGFSQEASPENPHVYYAKYQFKAREPGELGFEPGDKIIVIDTSDDIWWMGVIDQGEGRPPLQGVFPSNYVTELEPLPLEQR